MNTDVPAAVSPFDAAFDGPESSSCQEIGTQEIAVNGERHTMLYDPDNPFAWISARDTLEVGGQ